MGAPKAPTPRELRLVRIIGEEKARILDRHYKKPCPTCNSLALPTAEAHQQVLEGLPLKVTFVVRCSACGAQRGRDVQLIN